MEEKINGENKMNECCNSIKKTLDGVCVFCAHNKVCGIRDSFKSFSDYASKIDCDSEYFELVPKCKHFMSISNRGTLVSSN